MTQRTNQFKALHRNAMERAMQIDEAGGEEEGGVARSADEDEADTSAQRTSKHNLMYSILLSVAQ